MDKAIPCRAANTCRYPLTAEDKEYIKSFAVDGVVPFEQYIAALNKILNKEDASKEGKDNE